MVRMGGRSDPRRAHAVRRVVSRTCPWGPAGSITTSRCRTSSPGRSSLVGGDATFRWSLYLLLAFWPVVGLRGRSAAGPRALARRRRRADLTAAVERSGARVRVGELRLARLGHVGPALGDVGAPVRVGSVLAGGRQGQASVAGCPGARAHDLPAPADRLPRAVLRRRCSSLWRPGRSPRRLGRAAIVVGGALLASAWMLVPLLTDAGWTVNDEFSRGTIYYDSFGARKILAWLGTGDLLDRGQAAAHHGAGRRRAGVRRRAGSPSRTSTGRDRSGTRLDGAVLRPPHAGVRDRPAARRRGPVPAPVHQRGAPGGACIWRGWV